MNIVTLNMWGNSGPYQARCDLFLEELNRLKPDIVCLQEVWGPDLSERVKKTCGLTFAIASYPAGLVILTRFSITSKQILKYKTLSATEDCERHAIMATLEVTPHEKMAIANTHLSWKAEDKPIRFGQVKELIKAVKKIQVPAILTGDFNDVPNSRAIKEIKKAGYLDLFEFLNPRKKAISWDNRNPFIQTHRVKFPDRRIDFLFFNKELLQTHAPKICEIVFHHPNRNGIYPSDHYGVFAEVHHNHK